MLRVEEINDDKRFWDLGVEWNRILGESSTNNVFLTWEWISTFWKHFGKSKHLKLLFAEDATHGKLALAPLRLSDQVVGGFFRYKVLEPLAYGASNYRELLPPSDYTDLIIPQNDRECLSRFLDYLTEDKGWDFAYLADIPETSQTLKLLPTMKNQMGKIDFLKGVKCPYLPLSNMSITHLNHLLKRGARMKSLQRDYSNVAFKNYSEIGTVEQAFRAFVDLHKKGWKARGKLGAIPTQELLDFYSDVSEVFAKKNWLNLDFLTVDDTPIASNYSFIYDGRMYLYLSGWDPAFAHYSVGTIMQYGTIKRCVDLRLKEIDFLKGDESHKFHWTSEWRQNHHVRLVNKRFKSEVLDLCIKTSKFTRIDRLAGKLLKFT